MMGNNLFCCWWYQTLLTIVQQTTLPLRTHLQNPNLPPIKAIQAPSISPLHSSIIYPSPSPHLICLFSQNFPYHPCFHHKSIHFILPPNSRISLCPNPPLKAFHVAKPLFLTPAHYSLPPRLIPFLQTIPPSTPPPTCAGIQIPSPPPLTIFPFLSLIFFLHPSYICPSS